MFCPNCGNDCGAAKFCVKCGTKIEQAEKEAAWSVGMPCPHCGGTKLDGNNCASCGARLQTAETQKKLLQDTKQKTEHQKALAAFPVNTSYIGTRKTYLDVNTSSITVSPTLGYAHRTQILFEQLVAVIYMRPGRRGILMQNGVLLFRDQANKDTPIPDVRRMERDQLAVIVPPDKATIFYHVFQMLKTVAPSTARFQIITPESKIRTGDASVQEVDMDFFWNRYAPFRERAAKEIQAKYRIGYEAAMALVEREFDARQKVLYDAAPQNAVIDLDLVVNGKSKDIRNYNRLRNELREARAERELEELNRKVGYIQTMMLSDRLDDK